MSKAKSKNLTPYEVLTIASLVERETAVPRERKLIASVIYNRLAQDQRLDIDATVRFIHRQVGQPLTQSELQTATRPYNTRMYQGPAPGPDRQPGPRLDPRRRQPGELRLPVLRRRPVRPEGLRHTFHRTLAEFNAAAARYNQAREAAGGRAPKGC